MESGETVLQEKFQSTRPSRDGTMNERGNKRFDVISIHPPLAGRDVVDLCDLVLIEISIHPPLAGRD